MERCELMHFDVHRPRDVEAIRMSARRRQVGTVNARRQTQSQSGFRVPTADGAALYLDVYALFNARNHSSLTPLCTQNQTGQAWLAELQSC